MKLAQLNSSVPNSSYGEVDVSDRHFKMRTYYLVEDSYDFAGNGATEITGAEADEWIDRLSDSLNRNLHNETLEYEIESDSDILKNFLSINYKTELKSGIAYTPVFIIHDNGVNSGLLNKTEYYRGFVDAANKGTLVLVVEEVYVIDTSDPSQENSAKPATERTKTWKHVKKGGPIDEVNVKVKDKKYDTRRKRHKEGIRRRENIQEQLIDNVGLAGVLSGAFTDVEDAYNKLVLLQKDHGNSFAAWLNSGRDPLYTDITNDSTTAWLDTVIPDNGTTQAMCAWMIGLDFRTYIVDKLKGNVK